MSDERNDGAERAPYPPEWMEEAERLGDPGHCAMWSTTPGGAAELALWRDIGPVTDAERAWALSPLPLASRDAPARVLALRAARAKHTGLSDATWADLVASIPLPVAARTNVDAIAAAIGRRVAASRELLGAEIQADRREWTAPALAARRAESARWVARAQELRDSKLSYAQIALRLSGERRVPTSERTIARWLSHKKP